MTPPIKFLRLAALAGMMCSPLTAAETEMKDPAAFQADLIAYEKSAISKLEAKDFTWLDQEAERLQKSREHTQIGGWKLRQFVNALTKPSSPQQQSEWGKRVPLLEAWNKKSKTAFSAEMLGAGHLTYAWSFRGGSYAKDVSQEGWEGFKKELDAAEPLLQESLKKDPKNPDVYRQLLNLGQARGWPREKMDEILKQGIAVAPDYLEYYMVMGTYLLPQWFGKPGDWQKFTNSLPDLVPGDDGYAMYADSVAMSWVYYQQTPQQQREFFGEDRADRISWQKMKKGFGILRKRYPESAHLLNREAFFAGMAQDMGTLAADLKILDEKNLIAIGEWGTPGNLEMARKAVSGK